MFYKNVIFWKIKKIKKLLELKRYTESQQIQYKILFSITSFVYICFSATIKKLNELKC